MAHYDARKAKQFMKKNKIPLEIMLSVSIESKFDEITILSQRNLGLSHKSIGILLNAVDESIKNFDFEKFCQNLRDIHSSLVNIPLDTDLMLVNFFLFIFVINFRPSIKSRKS